MPFVEALRQARGPVGGHVDMSVGSGGLGHAVHVEFPPPLALGRDVAGRAQHPSHHRDPGGPGQRLDALRCLVLIQPVDLGLVVEIGDGAGAFGQHEAVAVETEAVLDRPRVADRHGVRFETAGVVLGPRNHEPPVDQRVRRDVVDHRLDGPDVFDVGFQNAHLARSLAKSLDLTTKNTKTTKSSHLCHRHCRARPDHP